MADFLSTLFGGGAEADAAAKNRALLDNYLKTGTTALDTGLASSKGALNDAGAVYKGVTDKYGKGTGLYLDALGVNGADAAKAAQTSFTTSPGYQAGIDAGIDVLNRRRAAGSMLDSGNADIDALTLGQNTQNKEFGSWLDRLGGLQGAELTGVAGQAGVDTKLSDLYSTDATNRIGLQGNYTSGNIGANNSEAAGKAAGAKNLLGGALSLATLGTSLAGGTGLGSALKPGGTASTFSYGGNSYPMFT